jgi:heme/copper-type cytochrome/quinol oxidase subunit 2
MKTFLIYLTLAIASFVVNLLIYNYSFNLQATPFLLEEQRVDSGLLMLKTTLPAYFVSSVVVTIMFYFAAKYLKRRH